MRDGPPCRAVWGLILARPLSDADGAARAPGPLPAHFSPHFFNVGKLPVLDGRASISYF